MEKKKVATQNAEENKINKQLEPFGVQETVATN